MPRFITTNNIYTTTVFNGWITTQSTATTATIWNTWVVHSDFGATGTTATGDMNRYFAQHLDDDMTPERREHMAQVERECMARMEVEARERERARRRAARRALATMLTFITPEQRAEYKRNGHFHVVGGATGRRYRLRRGRVANIDVLDERGRVNHRLCCHPAPDVPDCDTMLAQALYLQAADEEEQFVRLANIHPAPPPTRAALAA